MIYIREKDNCILSPLSWGEGVIQICKINDNCIVYVCDELGDVFDSITDIAYSISSQYGLKTYCEEVLGVDYCKDKIRMIRPLTSNDFNFKKFNYAIVNSNFEGKFYVKKYDRKSDETYLEYWDNKCERK